MNGRTDVEVLEREECLRLLRSAPVGRVAVEVPDGPPLVVPVNFLLVGEYVVFRIDVGTVFRQTFRSERPISCQVDSFDVVTRTGWSVLVGGPASELEDWEARPLTLRPWAAGPEVHWVALRIEVVSGRRLLLPELPGWPDRAGYL
jgi:nitroimidazol reductase NimA-like FMN-containing flavoprotein (pyridoxamine 5'-phosphate oxidase superfamily)